MMFNADEAPTTFFPSADVSDLDFSFNSTTSSSSSSFATTVTSSSSSARNSLSFSLPSFSTSTSLINPLPHSKSNCSPHWSAVRATANLSRDSTLHLHHLRLLRHLGSGHLAKVFHCRLKGSDAFDFALKVVDLDAVAKADSTSDAAPSTTTTTNKLSHVRSEARVLAAVDHPFLPTLYARMDASHYACFLIDYCPGGDLHSLLVRHPGHRLPLSAARFFAAEVLLALEYLHALGFVYRDLKPENVLIRSDGHIMLSDFDLCFSSEFSPSLRRRRVKRRRRRSGGCWRPSGGDKLTDEESEEIELVAEPEDAFSSACVGTHEYLAPEIVGGNGHGNGVHWWAFGVFIYELIYGRTPFRGPTKEATLKNILRRDVKFPDEDEESEAGKSCRDLIRRLLVRDPKERMGCTRGAAEIKRHPFFRGVRWQLIRCERPPVAVGPAGAMVVREGKKRSISNSSSSSRGGGWWSRVVKTVVSGKRGIKMGLVGSNYKSRSKRKSTGSTKK